MPTCQIFLPMSNRVIILYIVGIEARNKKPNSKKPKQGLVKVLYQRSTVYQN